MLKIGLTGGIGSGKTAVSDRFTELGVPVIDTDILAREVVEPGEIALEQLVRAFGDDILDIDGRVNRQRLRKMVFSDPKVKQRVESIVHPAIRDKLQTRLQALEAPYCVIVVPLLVETDFNKMVDRVLVVNAPRDRRIQWIVARNGVTRSEVERIMETQATTRERSRIAHDIIDNDRTLEALNEKVDQLHDKYLAVATRVQAR